MTAILILALGGVACLLSEVFSLRQVVRPLVVLALAAAAAAAVAGWDDVRSVYHDMLRTDHFATAFTVVLVAVTLLWTLVSPGFFREPSSRTDHYSLILFALTGAVVMVSYSNIIMLFLGVEILSIPLYVLAGSRKSELSSNEASMKYFLMGAFATGFLLFGAALVYGATGSFGTEAIAAAIAAEGTSMILYAGILMMMVALAFKSSVAPFHFWAPDVYQGSPTPATAFMSTVVKTAALAAFFRLFATCFATAADLWTDTLWVLSAITILAGNITAIYQHNVKRMLAYSSVAHAGYMLMALLSMNDFAAGSLLYYGLAYSLSSLAAFTILGLVSREGKETYDAFRGLASRSPLLAFLTVISVLSLAGIPPLAGFFAKYYVFAAALRNGHTALVLIAVLGSLIGVYYYFRIIMEVFRNPDAEAATTPEISATVKGALLITAVATLLFGVAPGLVAGLL